MQTLDELTPVRGSRDRPSFFRRRLHCLARHWDILAVLLLVLASFPVEWLFRRMLVPSDAEINLIDDSWLLDTSFKASRGLWFGRDVAFTYGPLFQWLSSAPARARGFSMGAIYASGATLPLWLSFLLGYLSLQLLIPEQPPWKRLLLLLLLAVFWATHWEGRVTFAVFLFALSLRAWYSVQEHKLSPLLMGCASALLCIGAALYSADTCAYALAGLLLSLCGVALEGPRKPGVMASYVWALLSFGLSCFLLAIIVNALMTRVFDFSFWRNALAILTSYRWIEPSTMSREGKIHLVAAVAVGLIVFLIRGFTARNRNHAIAGRLGFLLSAFLFACVTMQSGLVRSDWIHILLAAYAMVFFTGVVLFSFASRIATILALLFAVSSSLLFGEPSYLLSRIRRNYSQLRAPLIECPAGFPQFDRVCYPEAFTKILQTTGSYLQERAGPRDFIVIFPYQNIFGVAARRNVAGGVLQSYLVSGDPLSEVDLAGLERASPSAGLYLPDGDQSLAIDGVPNFTRTPKVWFWTFRHFRREDELVPGIFGLQRDNSRAARITMQLRPLHVSATRFPVPTRSTTIDLGDPGWPTGGADFFCLRVTVRYSLWWKLRKPARLSLEIERADSSRDLKPFVVPPNVSSEVWFYPWDDADLAQYFDSDVRHWHIGLRPAITRLRLLVQPLDWVSVQPDGIEVESADAVRLSMNTGE